MKRILYFLLIISSLLLFYHFQGEKLTFSSEKSLSQNPKSEVVKAKSQPVLAQNITPVSVGNSVDSIQIPKDDLLGKLNMRKHADFVNVSVKYAVHQHFWLRKEVYEAFLKMREKAEKDGFKFKITSAGRSFYDQKGIWEAKWKARRPKLGSDKATAQNILKYSSMPGMSRHHWGTDIDMNNKNSSYWETQKGKKEYTWLIENAPKFGFCQTYTPKDETRPEGYNEEKWHWSYMPLASKFLKSYQQTIDYKDINGFSGAHTAEDLQTIQKYVFGINPDCK